MKKLLSLPTILLSALAVGQITEGINQEHLSLSTTAMLDVPTTVVKNEFPVQRIALKTGVTLDYVEKGNAQGTPVIFLHGITDSWHSFESVLKHLPSSIRGFALTQRRHGDSEKPLEGYAPKDFAADVAAFIEQKKLGAAIVVGHSMGGVHAQQFALSYPKLARAIVIIDSDASLIDNPGMPEFYREVNKMQGIITRQFMDEFQKATLAKPIDSAYYNLLVDEGTKTPVRVFQAALKGILQVDLVPQLQNIHCPTLILWGDKDAFCFRNGQEIMVSKIKNVKLVVYEGVGHALHWEEPKRFVNDLVQFVQSMQFRDHEKKAQK